MSKLMRIVCLVLLLAIVPCSVFAATAAPVGPCRMIDPSTCADANQLVRASGFVTALGHFAGDSKVNYFRGSRSVSEQALAALGGSSPAVQALADNHYLFTACPTRECGGSAAAIIVNEYGQIEALGFSSYHCDTACDDFRHLDFYVRKDGDNAPLIAALKAWSTGDALKSTMWRPEADQGLDKRTDVHTLP
ncbi:hypothetical protein [Dyella japonica]|uniref:Uncharacterized protein n=1 Tax=Dyella japonica A8 TaxID=1217721 RepID=A0A075KAM0_9GAMM|nr:hypothetical protein [Dyella japonica]AIF49268.1 hypothetical protein HY57_19440 [Dyella japonica A8]